MDRSDGNPFATKLPRYGTMYRSACKQSSNNFWSSSIIRYLIKKIADGMSAKNDRDASDNETDSLPSIESTTQPKKEVRSTIGLLNKF